jgi:hypothetical protein
MSKDVFLIKLADVHNFAKSLGDKELVFLSILSFEQKINQRLSKEMISCINPSKNELVINITPSIASLPILILYFSNEPESVRFSFFIDKSGEIIDEYINSIPESIDVAEAIVHILSHEINKTEYYQKGEIYKIAYTYSYKNRWGETGVFTTKICFKNKKILNKETKLILSFEKWIDNRDTNNL